MDPKSVVHRSIVVNVHPRTNGGAMIAVIARTSRHGRRHDHLVWRGQADDADFRDIESILRTAAATVSKAADSL